MRTVAPAIQVLLTRREGTPCAVHVGCVANGLLTIGRRRQLFLHPSQRILDSVAEPVDQHDLVARRFVLNDGQANPQKRVAEFAELMRQLVECFFQCHGRYPLARVL